MQTCCPVPVKLLNTPALPRCKLVALYKRVCLHCSTTGVSALHLELPTTSFMLGLLLFQTFIVVVHILPAVLILATFKLHWLCYWIKKRSPPPPFPFDLIKNCVLFFCRCLFPMWVFMRWWCTSWSSSCQTWWQKRSAMPPLTSGTQHLLIKWASQVRTDPMWPSVCLFFFMGVY